MLKIALVLTFVLEISWAQAQSKIAYIALSEVTQLMPEVKTLQTQMADYEKQWMDQLRVLNDDYTKKLKDYQDQEKTLPDVTKVTRQTELRDLQKRYEDLNQKAREAVEGKAAELSKPLNDKVKGAIAAVAKEKGYAYVFNSSQTDMVVSPAADNLLAAVKLKLGLK